MYVDVIHRIGENKKDGKEPCSSCPLRHRKAVPPAWFECADAHPQVVVVSESPVDSRIGNEKEKGNSILENRDVECWARYILLQCRNQQGLRLSEAGTMGRFLGILTRGRIYNEAHESRTHGLYWTHTVKCFLQDEKYKGIRKAKENCGFRQVVNACRNYLRQEIESIQPKLVVAVGNEAFDALNPLKDEGQLKYELVKVYHPAWYWRQRSNDDNLRKIQGRLKDLRSKVEALGLIDVLPGCIEDP